MSCSLRSSSDSASGRVRYDAISRASGSESTINIARRISQALKVRGFSLNGRGGGSSGRGDSGTPSPIELYSDPTTLEGPAEVVAEDGKNKFVRYMLNARDDFMPARGELKVACDHPEINDREITVGELSSGYIRVSIAVPEGTAFGEYALEVSVTDWFRAGGGLGAPLRFLTKLKIVDEVSRTSLGGGNENGNKGADQGGLVGVLWSTPEDQSDWHNGVPGHIEPVPAKTLAAAKPEYESLAALDDSRIPTIVLNKEYGPLKAYIGARARELTQRGVDEARDRYAVGTGLGLLFLDQQLNKRFAKGEKISDEALLDAKQAVARSVLATMPAYDTLAREVGVNL